MYNDVFMLKIKFTALFFRGALTLTALFFQKITYLPGKIKDANDVNFSVGNLGLSLKKSKIEGKTDLTQIYEKNVASPKFLQCY